MNHSTTAPSQYTGSTLPAGVAAAGSWLRSKLSRMLAGQARARAVRERSREAARVRTYATTLRDSDPGFAADLYAAADRHERVQD